MGGAAGQGEAVGWEGRREGRGSRVGKVVGLEGQ